MGAIVCYNLDSQWENVKLFDLIYYVYLKKFELFWAWLLKKRDNVYNEVHYGVLQCVVVYSKLKSSKAVYKLVALQPLKARSVRSPAGSLWDWKPKPYLKSLL